MSETAAVRDGFAQIWAKLDVIGLIPNIVVSLIVACLFFILSWAASVFVRHVLHQRGRRDLGHMLASFTYWVVLCVGFLIVITIMLPSVHPADIFASLGIGSLALGFALKDILQNWIAGFLSCCGGRSGAATRSRSAISKARCRRWKRAPLW